MDKRFSAMVEKMDKRFSGVEGKIDDVNLNVRKGFSSLHDFDRNRVATMLLTAPAIIRIRSISSHMRNTTWR